MNENTNSPDPRKVVITGCSRGLGFAAAEAFLARGAIVGGCARTESALEPLQEIAGECGLFVPVDVVVESQVVAFAEAFVSRFGAPDLVLNNAALINRSAPLWELPAEEFDPVIDVNLKGVANVLRHFLPPMIEAGSGVMVNFSSGWGRSTSPEVAPYCATKWGIEGLSAALAQELPPGLASVALNPGIIDTEMLRSCFGASAGSYGDAEDWAQRAVPFFEELSASDNGRALTAP